MKTLRNLLERWLVILVIAIFLVACWLSAFLIVTKGLEVVCGMGLRLT